MIKVLVTGAAGFIPSSLIDKLLLEKQISVVGVDNLLTGNKSNLNSANEDPRFTFIRADANSFEDMAPILSSNSFDFIFHYAAVVGVQRTLANPLLVLHDINGINNILSLAKNTSVKRIFFSSSSEVYGEPVEIPQNEMTTPLNSRLPYAIVKNVGEAFLKAYQQEHGLDYTIFRFFNTYGSRQSTDFVLSKFIRNAIQGKDITVYGDGMQTRTFCYIDDNVDATINCLNQKIAINQVVNMGSDIEIPIRSLAKLVIDITNSSSRIIHLPPLEDGDMRRRCPDNSLMKEILGRSLHNLEDGIKLILKNLPHQPK
jgi:nucleoside-diphosphate-sugar epimerase